MNDHKPTILAAVFDLDGVLLDSEWLAFHVWREWAESCGGALEVSNFPAMAGLSAEETAVFVMEKAGVKFNVSESVDWAWKTVINRMKTNIDPLPGAKELVCALTEQGLRLAIASNSPGYYVENALSGLNLMRYFPVRVTIDQVANGKPAPDVYLRAAQQLGVLPQHCLAVEDSQVGFRAAMAAGMRVLAVPSAHDQPEEFQAAWRVYRSLEQAVDELDVLLR